LLTVLKNFAVAQEKTYLSLSNAFVYAPEFAGAVYKFIKERGGSHAAFIQANLGLTASARAPKMNWKKDESILHV
jgi:hypothetical protein